MSAGSYLLVEGQRVTRYVLSHRVPAVPAQMLEEVWGRVPADLPRLWKRARPGKTITLGRSNTGVVAITFACLSDGWTRAPGGGWVHESFTGRGAVPDEIKAAHVWCSRAPQLVWAAAGWRR